MKSSSSFGDLPDLQVHPPLKKVLSNYQSEISVAEMLWDSTDMTLQLPKNKITDFILQTRPIVAERKTSRAVGKSLRKVQVYCKL